MAALVLSALMIFGGIDGEPWRANAIEPTAPAVRATHGCTADPLCTLPAPTPADLVPPGTHCLELLDAFMAAGGQPENYEWYGNVAWGETHCHTDARNCQIAGCVWGPLQISFGSWSRLCGLSSGAELYDPETTFRCAFAIEEAAGRRQWRPHNEITGCFPMGVGVSC